MKNYKRSLLGLVIAGILTSSIPVNACTNVMLKGSPLSGIVGALPF